MVQHKKIIQQLNNLSDGSSLCLWERKLEQSLNLHINWYSYTINPSKRTKHQSLGKSPPEIQNMDCGMAQH